MYNRACAVRCEHSLCLCILNFYFHKACRRPFISPYNARIFYKKMLWPFSNFLTPLHKFTENIFLSVVKPEDYLKAKHFMTYSAGNNNTLFCCFLSLMERTLGMPSCGRHFCSGSIWPSDALHIHVKPFSVLLIFGLYDPCAKSTAV